MKVTANDVKCGAFFNGHMLMLSDLNRMKVALGDHGTYNFSFGGDFLRITVDTRTGLFGSVGSYDIIEVDPKDVISDCQYQYVPLADANCTFWISGQYGCKIPYKKTPSKLGPGKWCKTNLGWMSGDTLVRIPL